MPRKRKNQKKKGNPENPEREPESQGNLDNPGNRRKHLKEMPEREEPGKGNNDLSYLYR
jgi:hypothetical protein